MPVRSRLSTNGRTTGVRATKARPLQMAGPSRSRSRAGRAGFSTSRMRVAHQAENRYDSASSQNARTAPSAVTTPAPV